MKLGCTPYEQNQLSIQHRGRPGEPFLPLNAYGHVFRVAPAGRYTPQMAYVVWDATDQNDSSWVGTWERTSDLRRV